VTNPHHALVSDELRMAIGDLAIAAAALEFQLTFLVAVARDEDDERVRDIMSRSGEPHRQLVRLVGEVDDQDLRRRLDVLAREASAVLVDRHRLIHAVALIDFAAEGRPIVSFWNAREDREVLIEAAQVNDHVRDINTVAAHALHVTRAANQWRRSRASS
jgi:hypothetical protein